MTVPLDQENTECFLCQMFRWTKNRENETKPLPLKKHFQKCANMNQKCSSTPWPFPMSLCCMCYSTVHYVHGTSMLHGDHHGIVMSGFISLLLLFLEKGGRETDV